MDSNLDQMDIPRGSNEEFEAYLNDWYAEQEAEEADRQMAEVLYAQMEYEKLEREIDGRQF